jgi:hypothetical protein
MWIRSRKLGIYGGWAVAFIAFVLCLLVAILQASCGGSETTPPPAANACGVSGEMVPAMPECTNIKECGAGTQNYAEVSFCEHCFPRADTHFCEAGTCRQFDAALTNLSFSFQLPPSTVASAKSVARATVNPIMADGTKLTCAKLRSSDCSFVNNPQMNARNSTFSNLNGGGDFYMLQMSVDPGEDRILFVQVTDDTQGKGSVLATGCVENIDVVAGQSPAPVEVTFQ